MTAYNLENGVGSTENKMLKLYINTYMQQGFVNAGKTLFGTTNDPQNG